MMLKNVPEACKGRVRGWLLEIDPGVFLGTVSARVRDNLWQAVCDNRKDGYVLQVWSDSTSPQGMRWRSEGQAAWQPVDFQGIMLIQRTSITSGNSA